MKSLMSSWSILVVCGVLACVAAACGDSTTSAVPNNSASTTSTNNASNNATTTANNGTTTANGTTTTNGSTTPECDAGQLVCDGACTPVDTVERCGSCSPCPTVANASASCVEQTCVYACNPGAQDLNGDLADGCEATCTPTGPDICDGVDNDCDGVVDQSSDDLLAACPMLENTRAVACADGVCVLACEDGFTDLDGDLEQAGSNGCECVGDSTAAEVCDGIDNNCDGQADELNPMLVSNCTEFDGASPIACTFGECAFACDVGRVDINLDLGRPDSDGCECTITNSGFEVCDGLDNNCDGRIDEDNTELLSNCAALDGASVTTCAQGTCVWVCDQGRVDINDDLTDPNGDGCECTITNDGAEVCDGLDNDCDGLVDDADDDYIRVFCEPNVGVCANIEATCNAGMLDQCDFDTELIISTLDDPSTFEGLPDNLEIACDGIDGNCNGDTDENCCSTQVNNNGNFYVNQLVQGNTRQVIPSIATSPDGQHLSIVWQETENIATHETPSTGVVYIGFGDINDTTINVSQLGDFGSEGLSPKIQAHIDGPLMGWIESGFGTQAIRTQKHNWSGELATFPIRSVPLQEDPFQGFDIYGFDDSFLTVWASRQGCISPDALSCIQIKSTTYTGDIIHGIVDLTSDHPESNAVNPSLAWSNDAGLVVWHSRIFGPNKSIIWKTLNSNLEEQVSGSVPLRINPDAQPSAIFNQEEYWIIFVNFNQQDVEQINILRINLDGQAIGEPRIVAPSDTTQRSPKLVQTPEGIALVWVEGEELSNSSVRFVRLDEEGSAVDQPKLLWEGWMNYQPIAVAPIPNVGAVVAASFASSFAPEHIQYSIINADGDRLCLP